MSATQKEWLFGANSMRGITIALLIFVVMAIILGVFAFVLYKIVKKVDPKSRDMSENPDIKTTQEFLPFEDIRNDVIVLSPDKYRAVLMCNSTNYRLKTEEEKDMIELSFQRFLNTINFPITFFLQTKVIDNSARIASLETDLKKTVSSFPGISEYAESYLKDMKSLNQALGNNQQKKRYIIITYDNTEELNQLSKEEKIDYSIREVWRRAQVVQNNLDAVGVSSHVMTTDELIELVYSSYWRDDYSYASELSNGDSFSLFVDGKEDRFNGMSKSKMMDLIFEETIQKMILSGLDRDEVGKAVLKRLEDLRSTAKIAKTK